MKTLGETAPPTRIAPRASKVTEPLLPDFVVRLAPPKAAEMAVGLGATPDGKRAANPAISCCFSAASTDPLLSESVPTIQPSTLACIRKLICLFRRTASNRVNFNMSETRAAALLSWYVRIECMSVGMAMADRMRTTVSETASSTMLKPRLRLRRVPENVALRPKVVSSFGCMTGIPVYARGPNHIRCNCGAGDGSLQAPLNIALSYSKTQKVKCHIPL